jgi:hypothetical protein
MTGHSTMLFPASAHAWQARAALHEHLKERGSVTSWKTTGAHDGVAGTVYELLAYPGHT